MNGVAAAVLDAGKSTQPALTLLSVCELDKDNLPPATKTNERVPTKGSGFQSREQTKKGPTDCVVRLPPPVGAWVKGQRSLVSQSIGSDEAGYT